MRTDVADPRPGGEEQGRERRVVGVFRHLDGRINQRGRSLQAFERVAGRRRLLITEVLR